MKSDVKEITKAYREKETETVWVGETLIIGVNNTPWENAMKCIHFVTLNKVCITETCPKKGFYSQFFIALKQLKYMYVSSAP